MMYLPLGAKLGDSSRCRRTGALLAIGQVQRIQLEQAVATRDEGQRLAVRRNARADVVAAAEGDALGRAAIQADLVDLRPPLRSLVK
jgi:hypothetical protein